MNSIRSAYANYYAAPYYAAAVHYSHCGPHPTVSSALDCMYHYVVPPGSEDCPYSVEYFPDGPTTGRFATYNFSGFGSRCGGGNHIVGTRYISGNPPLKSGTGCDCCDTQSNVPGTMDGNPCDAASGNKFQTEIDYKSSSFNFVRYYNSLYATQSDLGNQWTHHYLGSLTIGETIQVHRPNGKILKFINNADTWLSDADIKETLTPVGLNWEYKTNNDTIETYNDVGQLQTITTRDGKTTHFTFNAIGLLEQISGPYGRTLGFIYDTSNRLITLTTPENTQIHYAYSDVNNHMISVTYPDNTPGDLTDNPQKIYHYEDAIYPNHLTGITDENGIRYATYAYNYPGLAILTEHANQAEKVELVYNADGTTTVTDALGRIKTYTFETHYGLRKPTSIQYTYNDGQQLITKTQSYLYYPENGWLKQITDYEGYITYYEYNTRGLITLETQAKGTLEEYSITTTWHPNYRLPASRTYPDRTETYSYDSTGQLINTLTSTVQ
ncbi:MAG: hypothetical protein KZQ64_04335 [gamma proteobacterium symbiont of Bathyaustriella thionipta]|nr:hypothetical protein [gamma proteobacterium symbiont of Bathyaustriella thionipta]MCU7952607.1 hypothetical protein [gamma proteobacterium symbiont of Bathyaustriella thionipta]MCU7955104.1 hypothetical protein [gamma proteobacterium symbiont of Bathyaustriella thionipta]MCU7966496.1 hypothetical protein [gamma proteobacterium symbiont of Bathyaustriella thionipta]